jgi:hypothetical protein
VRLREEHRALITNSMGRSAGKALVLLEQLYFRPIVSAQWVAEATPLSFANANLLIKRLMELGLLQETTGQRRNRRFSYEPYLALFNDVEREVPEAP